MKLTTILDLLQHGPTFFISLCITMFIFLEIGRYIRRLALAKNQVLTDLTLDGPVESVLFALFGLLIAFTFTGAGARLEAKRQLITVEANAIDTAYLRIGLLPKEAQPQMRKLFKEYTLIRANTNEDVADTDPSKVPLLHTAETLQNKMWDIAINGCRSANTPNYCATLMLPALNSMFDITTSRIMASLNHPPIIIYAMLVALSLFSALLVGYDLPRSNRRNLLYMISYAIVISVVLYIIIDMELPHYGLISIDNADQILLDMANSM